MGSPKMAQRDSNMEMARILAMSMIVMWHFCVHGGLFFKYIQTLYFAPLLICGVNIFVLISGYYSIKLRLKSILNLASIIAFYLINLLLCEVCDKSLLTVVTAKTIIRHIIFPFTTSQYCWFVPVYFGLMLVSPFINRGLEHSKISEIRDFVIILTAIVMISGFFIGNMLVSSGYELLNFIYLYILGYYLHHENRINIIPTKYLVLALIICLSIFEMVIYYNINFNNITDGVLSGKIYTEGLLAYSNPLVIVQSAIVIVIFSKLKCQSKIINFISGGAFGVYLLQESSWGRNYIYPIQDAILQQSTDKWLLLCVALYIILWISSIVGTYITKSLSRPLVNALTMRIPFLS